jgi:hypothetical protein
MPTSPSTGGQKALIQGSYHQSGDKIAITLSLVSERDGTVLASSSFTTTLAELDALNLNLLPENRKTEAEVLARETLLTTAEAPPDFLVDAWPNEESRTYIDGNSMTIGLYSSKDCYVKVYHIDVNNNLQLIYPNRIDRDNTLKADTERLIPEKSSFVLGAPYGEETILAVFSSKQFENLEDELLTPVPASRETLGRAASGRGLIVEAGNPARTSPPEQIVSRRFNYTIIPESLGEETVSFKKPDDVSQTLQALKDEIISQGGKFSGDNREGAYSLGSMSGSYWISVTEIIITVKQAVFTPTRSAGGAYNFSFDRPANISGAVTAVKSAIEQKGGVFSGDTNAGAFRASGIAGVYHVRDQVSVTIQEKPFVIPNQMIEKEVKKYFGIR